MTLSSNYTLVGLAIKILGPIAIIVGLVLYHNGAVNKAETRGADSRNVEVATLTKERDDAAADVITLTGDLNLCRENKQAAKDDVQSLTNKLAAQGDEAKAALKLQAETFAATQRVTSSALNTLAKNTKAADVDFAAILEQLKGVDYGYNKETGRCVITGGGRVLRDGARGKIRN